MPRVRVIHWKAEEARPLVAVLRGAGFHVDFDPAIPPEILRAVRTSPPDAVVIDLSRLPSHGREMAVALRGNKQTRLIPILFVGGAPEKVEAVRKLLPDARYCDCHGMPAALSQCIEDAPVNPVKPTQMMDRYAGRTTAQKLGIVAGAKVAVMGAPRDYAKVMGALPEDVEFVEDAWKGCAVTVWFVEQPEALLSALPRMKRAAATSKLWVAWPKKAARPDSLVTEDLIRNAALGCGMVDYKVCSISSTWSGLCLAVKK